MTALVEMATLAEIRIELKATQPISLNFTSDLMEIELFSSAGGLIGKIRDLLFAKWNERALPTEPGLHENIVFVTNPVRIFYAAKFVECDIFAHLDVVVDRYFGQLSDAQIAMMKGEGPRVEMPSFEESWRKIGSR